MHFRVKFENWFGFADKSDFDDCSKSEGIQRDSNETAQPRGHETSIVRKRPMSDWDTIYRACSSHNGRWPKFSPQHCENLSMLPVISFHVRLARMLRKIRLGMPFGRWSHRCHLCRLGGLALTSRHTDSICDDPPRRQNRQFLSIHGVRDSTFEHERRLNQFHFFKPIFGLWWGDISKDKTRDNQSHSGFVFLPPLLVLFGLSVWYPHVTHWHFSLSKVGEDVMRMRGEMG